MKNILRVLIAFSAGIFITSCKTTGPTSPGTNSRGTPTPIGTPIGSPSTATIDAVGGSLMSPDGRLELIIPAGALNAATQISIQPGTNEAPLGASVAYSLAPNGQRFNLPVTLRFHYDAIDRTGTDTKVITIATQKDDRIWYAYKNINLDSVAGTLTITTKHFSWYAIADFFWLIPFSDSIKVKESLEMRVVGNNTNPYTIGPDEDGDVFWALHSSTDLGRLENENMSWSVNEMLAGNYNEGYINQGDYNGDAIATYVAPQTTKNMTRNPVEVSSVFTTPAFPNTEIHLLSNITVKEDSVNGYQVNIDYLSTMYNAGDVEFDYYDHASFDFFVYPGSDTIILGTLKNDQGIASNIKQLGAPCVTTITDAGNFLNIISVHGEFFPLTARHTLRLTAMNLYTEVSAQQECNGVVTDHTGEKIPLDFVIPLFDFDNTKKEFVLLQADGGTATVTITKM
jgi:hypothetical protein